MLFSVFWCLLVHFAMDELLSQYRRLLAEVDRWFASCLERFPDDIACARGCSSCCRGLFDITLLDAALLRSGFDLLPAEQRTALAALAASRIGSVRTVWPAFAPPYLLNDYPEEERPHVMPEDDETPCVLLDSGGFCILYEHRPLTCRLHGLPMVDRSGEVLHDEWCTLNFTGSDPLAETGLRGEFAELIREETALLGRFNLLVAGAPTAQLDTLIPAVLLENLFIHEAHEVSRRKTVR